MSENQQSAVQSNAQDTAQDTAKKHMPKWAIALIVVVVVAVIAVAGVFGFRAYSDAQYNNAVAACATASEEVRNATNDYNNLVNGDASEAASLTEKDVKDSSTLDALNKELSAELPEYEGCLADDTKGYQAATDKLNEQTDWYKSHTASLQKAVDAVNASKK
ncbi:hypothetical protein [Bifidobacterium olomucense]|uniref:Colicin transporter n=1 Tax=Bifidobacterium olomucense TaxID=2675324 RepID=A0A7Y0EY36_9BIFI|nr:hypothetical protein [Bifidobacterium sp. DSM 109959]NMM98541.1 hypothetical protein [Bifidobacterium sp. DSM 109959]